MILRDRCTLKLLTMFDDFVISIDELNDHNEPRTYKEAVNGSDQDWWRMAMCSEINSLHENETWV